MKRINIESWNFKWGFHCLNYTFMFGLWSSGVLYAVAGI